MNELPLDSALAEASRVQSMRLAELEAENARLKVTVVNMKRRLIQAKRVHTNWLIRAQSWRIERDDLLHRLSHHAPTTPKLATAYWRWGPES